MKMRTIAYVDGYNLYHGRLKYTRFKWLDLRGLLASILRIQDHTSELIEVKLFTHWTRDHILDTELAAHQFPERVQTGKKPADKPDHW
jgi:hypothetical protein